ncbi:MAG: hypothetical protein IKK74_03280 [Clostridia bacterium]|nr:hypothetical protein [Clostridia bacterium]
MNTHEFDTTEAVDSSLNTTSDCHIEAVLLANKHSRALSVIIIVLFVGILLSFLLNFGISAYLGTGDTVEGYFDGEEHKDIVLSKFADTFYLSGTLRKTITHVDYYLFGRIPTNEVLLGDEKFLFPTYDEENSYNYVADYYGEMKPEPAKLELYYQGIRNITEAYEKLGVSCYFAVIPNAQTVYSERMPEFMGEPSKDTRLRTISGYFSKRGINNYIDLSDHLINSKGYGELYNNTEDSLNSRGAYYAYLAVLEKLPSDVKRMITPVVLNDEDLVQHSSTGKVLARAASLENVIKNKTVSLSTDFVQKYQILLSYDKYDMAFAKMQYRDDLPALPRIEFSFSSDWDRIIMIDYLSNTFGTAIYHNSLDFDADVINEASPTIHVIFLNERNIYKLADGSLLP